MNEPVFRPRSAVEILDASVRLYRANLPTLITISLVLFLPFDIIGAAGGPGTKLVMNVVRALIGPLVAAVIVGVVDDVLHGRPANTSGALDRIRGKTVLLIGVAFAQGVLTILGLVALIIPGLLAIVWTFAAPMAVVIEGVDGLGEAFSRARALARGHFGHVLGTIILAYVAVFFVVVVAAMVLGIVLGSVAFPRAAIGLLGSAIYDAIYPVVAVALTLLYFDLRVRTDAYDVESMMSDLPTRPVAPGAGAPGTAAPQAPSRTGGAGA